MDQKQKMKLPAGVKKHIRIEKARIRHDFLSKEDMKEQIEKLYNKFEYFILKPKQEIKKIINPPAGGADKKVLPKSKVQPSGPSSEREVLLKTKTTVQTVKKKITNETKITKFKSKKTPHL